ncbi:MAG: diguanylate cyclase [Magnetococcales bacterium]|nr:diguanylate cyclase [Magnetococcales bacterium]NGZ06033.1 diguanylate cyclase [Magnetococcales bacterium]
MSHILVVDDDGQTIEQTARLITNAGHIADFLLESQYLLPKLERSPPDLLLMDVNMPEIDGVTLLKKIQATPHLKEIPIIMITGETDEALIQECFQLGAVDFVNKPIRPLELLSRIRIALETKAHIHAIQAQKNALQRAKSFTDAILNTMEESICVIDPNTNEILEANRVFLEQINLARHRVIGERCSALLPDKIHACHTCAGPRNEGCLLLTTLCSGEVASHEFTAPNSQGQMIHTLLHTLPLRDGSGHPDRIVCLGRDITQSREREKHLKHLAFHDPLTHLPNRQLFHDRLHQALAQGRRHGQMVGVMLFDLDHFKGINDTLGHAAGDDLLREVANRLKGCVRESDTVARLGGDEFTAVLTNLSDASQVRKVAKKMLKALGKKYLLTGQKIAVTASIGVSLYPDDGDDLADLLDKADKALYHAKSAGRDTVRFFAQIECSP